MLYADMLTRLLLLFLFPTQQEDAVLRDQYPIYADTASVYTVLAQDEVFEVSSDALCTFITYS
jgi:hypothetical protein